MEISVHQPDHPKGLVGVDATDLIFAFSATVPGEDCTILFKDGTYKTDITVTTTINDDDKENTELFFYLFSEEETDIKQLEIKLLR